MISEAIVAGIDVSKDRLDVHVLPGAQVLSVDHAPKGLARLVGLLRRLGVQRIGLEASGGYERAALDVLAQAGFAVCLVPPARVRALAHALGRHAKTDPIDARMIACYVQLAPGQHDYQRDPARQRLDELAGLRRQLIAERNKLVSRLDIATDTMVRRMLARMHTMVGGHIARLDAEIASHIRATHLKARYEILLAVAGVGPVLAATLLCDLPELGHATPKQLASLVGVAPHARQSGRTARPGRCSGGRASVRNVLYMATLSALKARSPALRTFYDRLRANGKPFKVAINAAMRKFITILSAIVKQSTVA
ncbi:IS110 family transposase [Devosia salina]|uniref:IS110 family transposase n=1 Tax=Devosia salina TaxID=2860336 RepID=A0ABX8WGG1_9HYPH|nr:IS110 family transposase [Devosia salina]QYO75378.1 IS110 family transposase [Devosia salina]QYO75380.1 IS110 family transposase [Devosia salina]QYO75423.1 IS110 family transposase [Devosia salina]QYO75899.1 IS110 family transposase [Devosia salina]QYO75950.1 IS110 family transposase [Devosia salina]